MLLKIFTFEPRYIGAEFILEIVDAITKCMEVSNKNKNGL